MEKVTAYKCSFCTPSKRKLFLSRSGCSKHEKRCWLNPARKSCATCINLRVCVEEQEADGWKCLKRIDITPFKGAIFACRYWEESGAIFANEEEVEP